ncbi:MAG: hypothetical protein CM15mP23_00770 [Cryomorphaceae bacterium]|nr:MAG: hypothetical protein CM15mP23_00770 [Cryomorphaceae bacterium]
MLFAAGMVAYGTHEMEEFVVKGGHLEFFGMESKNEITRPWNVLVPKAELESGASELFTTLMKIKVNMFIFFMTRVR